MRVKTFSKFLSFYSPSEYGHKKEECLSKTFCTVLSFPTVQQEGDILHSAFRWANNTFTHFSMKDIVSLQAKKIQLTYMMLLTLETPKCVKSKQIYTIKERMCVSQVRKDVFVLGAFIKMDSDPHEIISLAPLKLSALSVSCPNCKTYNCFKTQSFG